MKGVPLRLEIGPKDIEKEQCVFARRDNGEKSFVSLSELVTVAAELLEKVHQGMFERAKKNLTDHTYDAETLEEAKRLQEENGGFIRTMWCGDLACELKMKDEAGMSSRCMPFGELPIGNKCAICGKPAEKLIYWGVAY